MTAGVIALGHARQLNILQAVAAFNAFDESNDLYGERDFRAVEVELFIDTAFVPDSVKL